MTIWGSSPRGGAARWRGGEKGEKGERVVGYRDLLDDWEKTGYKTLRIRPGKGAEG
jgi:hypothetical protein